MIANVSYFPNVYEPKNLEDKPLQEVLNLIKSERTKETIDKIRKIASKYDMSKKEHQKIVKDLTDPIKKTLPSVTFHGRFKQRRNDDLIESSGICILDLDDYGLNYKDIKIKLIQDKHIISVFSSPKMGLKALVHIPKIKNDAEFKIAFFQVVEYYTELLGVKVDESGNDVSRACFISSDPDIYINQDAKVFEVDFSKKIETTAPTAITSKENDKSRSAKEFGEVIRLIKRGLNKEAVFKEMDAFAKWANSHSQYKELTYSNALKQVNPVQPISTHLHPIQPNSTLNYSILDNKAPEIAQFKFGIHNNVYYFGLTVYDNTIPKKAVITSSKDLFVDHRMKVEKEWVGDNEIKKNFGLNYRYMFEDDVLDNKLTIAAAKKIIYEEPKTLNEVFIMLRDNNKKYMEYPDKTAHSVIALDILATYFLPCFEAMGRSFLEAEKGSGKTRQCSLYKLQACNTIMSADISKSAFFRLMESTCGTLVIDDFDSITDEQKTDVLQHYKTGYKAVSKSVRMSQQMKVDAFRNYGHVVMNNTSGLDDISADRTKFFPIVKVDGKVTTVPINEKAAHWQDVSAAAYSCALGNWKLVLDEYNNYQNDSLSGRKLEVVKPLLVLAKIIDLDLHQSVSSYLTGTFSNMESVNDIDNNWEYIALSRFFKKDSKFSLPVTDIADVICEQCFDPNSFDIKSKRHGVTIYLGKLFRKLPLFRVKTIHGKNHVELCDRIKFEKYLGVRGWSWVEMGGHTLGVLNHGQSVLSEWVSGVNAEQQPTFVNYAPPFLAKCQDCNSYPVVSRQPGRWCIDCFKANTKIQFGDV